MYIEIDGNQQLEKFFDFLRKEFNNDEKEEKKEFRFKSEDQDQSIKVETEKRGKGKSNICDTCGKQFKTKKILTQHLKCHGEKSFLCQHCDYTATLQKYLNHHIERMHPITPKPEVLPMYTCEHCGNSYKAQQTLNYHIESAHLDTFFNCDLCEKVFKTRRKLAEHKKCHGQTVACDLCHKSFPTYRNMTRHRYSMHVKEKKNNRIHIDKFVNSDNETRKRMENINGQWSCLLCDYQSDKSTNVYRHIESRHGDGQEYECQVCRKVFKGMNAYHNHIYKAHRNK